MAKGIALSVFLVFLTFGCANEASSPVDADVLATTDDVSADELVADDTPVLTAEQMQYSDQQAAMVDPELVRRNNLFALKLLRELRQLYPAENLFAAPVSISTAFAMAYAGSTDQTAQEIATVLEFGDYTPEQVNDRYHTLLESLMYVDNAAYLAFANSLWTHATNVKVFDSFKETMQTKYFSDALSFAGPQDVGKINGWIEEKTMGKIKNMIDEIPPDALLYLINAIYFKGGWKTPFDERDTHDAAFKVNEQTSVTVPTMSLSGMHWYCYGEKLDAVRMGYGREKIAMYFFRNFDLATVMPEDLSACVSSIGYNKLELQVPRFSFDWGTVNLNDALRNMGLNDFFFNPDFDEKMIEWWVGGELCVNRVLHKTFVNVDERGTEAAGATAIEVGAKSGPENYHLDQPFYFMIIDERTNAILFMGFLSDPTRGVFEVEGWEGCG